MHKFIFAFLVLITATSMKIFSQSRVTCTLTVSDNVGSSQTLLLGLDPSASNGIDATLGEVERPAIPARGTFDARFIGTDIGIPLGRGTLIDYRQGSDKTSLSTSHETIFQPKTGATQITVGWNVPQGVVLHVTGTIVIVPINITMNGIGTNTIQNPGVSVKLYMTATYDATAMPVELSSFTSSVSEGAVLLQWRTETEINNFGFAVERRSRRDPGSAPVWQELGFVEGSGTRWSPKEYSFSDKTTRASESYVYRLKQIDRDGTFVYSKEVDTEIVSSGTFDMEQNFPNPFNPSTMIRIRLACAASVSLAVYDLQGAMVTRLAERERLEAGIHSFVLDAAGTRPAPLASGTYFIRMTAAPLNGSGSVFTKGMKLVLLK
jgi:hypothetical protein